MLTKGVIYILTNPSFPEYVKIGYANDLATRLKQLNKSETIPFAFRAFATYDVDHRLTDKELHNLIDSLNPDLRSVETFNGKTRTKEFFAMSPEDAYSILEAIAKISGTTDRLHRVTPTGDEVKAEETAAEVKAESRRGPFRFSMVGIPVGAEIEYVNDGDVKAVVVDDRHIRMGNEVTSLSAAAQELLGYKHRVQGPMYWKYGDKVLNDIRNEMGM